MNITIKKATLDDLDRVVFLFDAYRTWYHQQSDVERAATFLSERITNNESVIFLAFIDGKAVGFTQLYPIFSSIGMGRSWLLNDLFVDAAARKQGIATALLNAARQLGETSESGWLLLQTSFDNINAQALYEKHGWVKESDLFYRLDITK